MKFIVQIRELTSTINSIQIFALPLQFKNQERVVNRVETRKQIFEDSGTMLNATLVFHRRNALFQM